MLTKAAQIRKLDDGKRSTREIADIVGCLDSYVRVVLRQRVNGKSVGDMSYLARFVAEHGCCPSTVRYRNDAKYRERELARVAAAHRRKKAALKEDA